MDKITRVHAREILDSRGFPTLEVEVSIGEKLGRFMVPSGASTGEGEALELRDGDPKRYLGKGVLKAVRNVEEKMAPALVGKSFARQSLLDDYLKELDGTPNKSQLGANAILGVSIAFFRASCAVKGQEAYQGISSLIEKKGRLLPVPLMNVLNGGKHADNGLAIQEFMIVPAGFDRFSDALRAGAEVFHHLKKLLSARHLSTAVGDEGGFAPVFSGDKPHEQALSALIQAISDAGYKASKQIYLALDCAASEFVSPALKSKPDFIQYEFEGKKRSADEMTQIYSKWMESYPIISIEDGLSEHDWSGWQSLTQKCGSSAQLVGDDLFVTNASILKKGIELKAANSVLIKVNQIGTLTETLETMILASQNKYNSVVSHRSGETEDAFIADLAVGTQCGQIKTGSLSRTDRIVKYNRLLAIEETLGNHAEFAGKSSFKTLQ